MKKFFPLIVICLFATSQAHAQDSIKYWTRAFSSGLNFNQASFSDNWTGGGTNSLALATFLNAKASYSNKKKISWDNELQLAYGLLQNQNENTKKTIDKMFFDSKLGYKIAKSWNLFASMNFSSQFSDGYKYTKKDGVEYDTLVSGFLSPGYLTSSVGFEYKPVDYFWIRFGSGTLRQTFVKNQDLHLTVPKNYGVEIGKTMKNEIALQIIASFDRDIMKNVNLKTRVMAIAPYDNPGRITSQLDVTLRAKVNRYVNVSISGLVLNDLAQTHDVQYSQGFALGFMYLFSEFK
ncbi:MAG: DUF3078 domain-containing protein [Bacteroidota bacterium]